MEYTNSKVNYVHGWLDPLSLSWVGWFGAAARAETRLFALTPASLFKLSKVDLWLSYLYLDSYLATS